MIKAPLCTSRSLHLCQPPLKPLFRGEATSSSCHTPPAVLPGCSPPGQARILREWNSSHRAASAFLVAVLPLNLSAKELFCILGPLPRCPSPFTCCSESLLRQPSAVVDPCDAQGPSPALLAAQFLTSALHPWTEGSREIFLLMRLLGLLVCRFCGDI